MAIEHRLDSALAAAVRKVGSQSAFGRLIGAAQPTVHDWLRDGKPLPAEHVLLVEAETGISRHELRPDIYPRDLAPAAPVVSAPAASASPSPLPPAAAPAAPGAATDPDLLGVAR